jgi:hypothetical protein
MAPKIENIDELRREMERLQVENETLRKRTNFRRPEVAFKITDYGAVSVVGVSKFPITLFKNQWELLFEKRDEILDYIDENIDKIAVRN